MYNLTLLTISGTQIKTCKQGRYNTKCELPHKHQGSEEIVFAAIELKRAHLRRNQIILLWQGTKRRLLHLLL